MKNLIAALAEFQKEMKAVPKGNKNPFYKSNYADLASIWTAAHPLLAKHGLAVSQTFRVSLETNTTILVTGLMHTSGENFSSEMILQPAKTPQELGSQITYMRRYSLAAILGIVTEDEDDDGNHASVKEQEKPQAHKEKAEPSKKKLVLVAGEELPKAFWALTASEKQAALGDGLVISLENGKRFVRAKEDHGQT